MSSRPSSLGGNHSTVVVVWASASVMLTELVWGRLMTGSSTPQYLIKAMLLPARMVVLGMVES